MNSIEVSNVSKKIGEKNILNNINFSCSDGQVLGIIGQNGAGKSTLFKILVGMIKPTEGSILINNIDIKDNYNLIGEKVGYLVESPALYPDLTGYDNLNIYFKMHNAGEKVFNRRIIDFLQINDYLNIKVKKYSTGMRQKLGIACALINNPEIIILDEPTNSLDAIGVKQVRELIKMLNKEKKLVIVTSHILKEIQEVCTNIIMINSGNIIEENNINNGDMLKITVLNKEKIDFNKLFKGLAQIYVIDTYVDILVDKNINLKNILKVLSENNIEIINIKENTNELEEYFIKKVSEN